MKEEGISSKATLEIFLIMHFTLHQNVFLYFSQSASPRKSGSIKTPLRKRRRLNVDKHYKNDQNSYVLKLYDRSVDLAKFSPQIPLYPVCRAWIKNQPNSQQSGAAK